MWDSRSELWLDPLWGRKTLKTTGEGATWRFSGLPLSSVLRHHSWHCSGIEPGMPTFWLSLLLFVYVKNFLFPSWAPCDIPFHFRPPHVSLCVSLLELLYTCVFLSCDLRKNKNLISCEPCQRRWAPCHVIHVGEHESMP